MKKLLMGLATLACLLKTDLLVSQDELPSLHGISAKLLFIDYNTLNSIDGTKISNGLELAYLRSLNDNLAIGLPVKLGLANIGGSEDKTTLAGIDLIGQYQFGTKDSKFRPYLLAGAGVVSEEFEENNVQIPVGLGGYLRAGRSSFFTLQAEYRKSLSDLRDNLQLGVGWHFKLNPAPKPAGPQDADQDGLPDIQDKCPDEAGSVVANGCPDTDDDGVPNGEDDCPTVRGPADNRGCPPSVAVTPPTTPAMSDRDGDGIADEKDQCPDEAGTLSNAGCPMPAKPAPTPTQPTTNIDTDGDGLVDSRDDCPDTPGPITLLGCPDRDGDGVIDKNDRCPDTPGQKLHSGCPDTDNDGFADDQDSCPSQVGVASANGCPDADGDGVKDQEDGCPNEKGLAANKGCPVYDVDNDGIPDKDDQCPNEKGSTETKGCPDSDGDGVPDRNDLCPTEKGPANGCPDDDGDATPNHLDKCPDEKGTNQGCPDIEKEDKEFLVYAAKNVQFETGKATLKAQSYAILEKVADIMDKYRRFHINIDGHTDDVGDAGANLRLSEERARSCYEFLLSKGVYKERMLFKGYGETRPVDTNKTPDGREKNRRVEFNMYIP